MIFRASISFSLTVIICSGVGCGNNQPLPSPRIPKTSVNSYSELVASETKLTRSGAKTIPVACQFESLFSLCDHFITHDYRGQKTRLWNSEAFIGGKFILTMQVPVTIVSHQVTPNGEYTFRLVEVRTITPLSDGRFRASFVSQNQKNFHLETWQAAADGDSTEQILQALGANVNSPPVPRFDEYVHAVRKDRIRVSLLNP